MVKQQEDINMANGFDNPYMTQASILDPTISGQIKYKGAGELESVGWGEHELTYDDPVYKNVNYSLSDLGYDPVQGYQYNMGSSIMDTLYDVFDQGASGFGVSDYLDADELRSAMLGEAGTHDVGAWTTQQAMRQGQPIYYETFDDMGNRVMQQQQGEFQGDPTFSFEEEVGGPSGALGFTNIFDKESIAAALTSMGGIDPVTGDPIRASEVTALTPEMIAKTESKYYDPLLESTREQAIYEKSEDLAKDVTGGFAGSTGATGQKAQAKRAYDKEIQSILATILKSKAGALGDVNKRIYSWQELMDI